ncbi:MAG: DUF2079 domain-containing protein [Candidatus Parcubacteria bacterium]|nr:DUF2079 domain-containing protein [Candidatus Parcubacteria bacterium]
MLNYFKNLSWPKLNKLLLVLIVLYFVLVFGLCLFKYFTFQYNALDLAIYNQVFYNSSLGNFFQMTIHPTSYLGDHLEFLVFFLVPFYALFKSPLTLLFGQTFFLALAVIPLYLIAKKYLTPMQTLLLLILYLFNPIVWNINLFEFHILALAPFFLGWTFYFYDQNKFSFFLIFSVLSLFIKEDIAFVIFMFGVLALLDKKKLKWILTPLILSTLYFFTALKIISFFSANQKYKFLGYYKWLGQNPQDIFMNFFLKFPLVLSHALTIYNFEFVLGILLVFLFLPLFKPRYLLLGLGMFMELILGPAAGELILRTHYGAIFLFAGCLSVLFAFKSFPLNKKFTHYWDNYKEMILLIFFIGLIYNFLVLGPFLPFLNQVKNLDWQGIHLKNEFIKEVPKTASVIAPYRLITQLSSRPQVYSLNYVFQGKQQYGIGDYIIPKDTQYLLIDFDDFLTYHVQYDPEIRDYYFKGDDNLRKLLTDNNFVLKKVQQNLALWQKDFSPAQNNLYEVLKQEPKFKNQLEKINEQIEFLGLEKNDEVTSLYFKALSPIAENYFLLFNNHLYPLGYGLYPTSEWQAGQIIKQNFFNLPAINEFKVINLKGQLKLNGLGSTYESLSQLNDLGTIILN